MYNEKIASHEFILQTDSIHKSCFIIFQTK